MCIRDSNEIWHPMLYHGTDKARRLGFEALAPGAHSQEAFWLTCYIVAIDDVYESEDFTTLAKQHKAPATCLPVKDQKDQKAGADDAHKTGKANEVDRKDQWVRKFSAIRAVRQRWGTQWWYVFPCTCRID